MQKSLGPKSAALRRPLRVLSGDKVQRPPKSALSKRHPPAAAQPPESVRSKPPPPGAAHPPEPVRSKPLPSTEPAAVADAALDRLLLARSDLAGIVSQIDELISDALQCQTMSTRGKQEIDLLSVFLSNTNASLKTQGMSSNPAAKRKGKLVSSCSNIPAAESVATPSCNLSCKCSSRCPTSKAQLKTASSLDQLDLPSLPVWKLTIADDDHPDPEQVMKVKEARTDTSTPDVNSKIKGSLKYRSPCTFSVQKNMRSVPRSCLKTALSSKQQLFSPIPEDSRKEDMSSDGITQGNNRSKACDDFSSSDEISKDLASRYDLYGLNHLSSNTDRRRETDDTLQWFLSPLKTCVLMNPSDDDKTNPTPANMKGQQDFPDGKPVQTPALHSKALLVTPWKGLESTNLKGRKAGETTLKKELWNRFEAVSTGELHFDKSLFQKIEGKRFLDMLEEAT
ncbi:hypothetical protein PR202_gb01925 [Eleusine coracana subsp. coracana]|uniref:Uncharacterized protein n=1 Tax=Eleusine coracana subsp. coracana TaxID=191504 RepID=A0AAV5DWE9_ELECO|nr:hypothetical protein PR202_gb01925 [Eleusine coracana subsp. coracana]